MSDMIDRTDLKLDLPQYAIVNGRLCLKCVVQNLSGGSLFPVLQCVGCTVYLPFKGCILRCHNSKKVEQQMIPLIQVPVCVLVVV